MQDKERTIVWCAGADPPRLELLTLMTRSFQSPVISMKKAKEGSERSVAPSLQRVTRGRVVSVLSTELACPSHATAGTLWLL